MIINIVRPRDRSDATSSSSLSSSSSSPFFHRPLSQRGTVDPLEHMSGRRFSPRVVTKDWASCRASRAVVSLAWSSCIRFKNRWKARAHVFINAPHPTIKKADRRRGVVLFKRSIPDVIRERDGPAKTGVPSTLFAMCLKISGRTFDWCCAGRIHVTCFAWIEHPTSRRALHCNAMDMYEMPAQRVMTSKGKRTVVTVQSCLG